MKPLGDILAANPIVHTIGLVTGCVDSKTNQLRPESTCNQVRIDLNEGRYADAFYDRFWKKAKQRRQNNAR